MKGKKNLHFLYSHALYVVQKYGIILIFAKKLRLIMTNRYKAIFLFAFLTFLTTTLCAQVNFSSATRFPYKTEHPLRETRAVWLTTIGGLDWPRVHAVDESSRQRQKAELISILDNYQKANINTVIFQTRVRAAVLYPSHIEPWELSLTGVAGKDPGYDPLAFCIDECHKRGMELHAWVVCIPIGTKERQAKYGSASLVKQHPDLVKTAKGGEMFMKPGNPQTAEYIATICKEIVENYDVDGISLDYIRYPESIFNYSDDELYPRSSTQSKAEWKRENITRIVKCVHDTVKPIKPWVKLSSSPIGKYRNTSRYSAGGWNGYDAVWQDPVLWLEKHYQDMLFPMMYFTGNNYYPFLYQWLEKSNGHPICPGLGIYFLDPREGRWMLNEVRAEMHAARDAGIGGIAFYRGEFLTKNCKGIYDATCQEFFPHPALTARMTWMGDTVPPAAPTSLYIKEGTLFWSQPQTSLPMKGKEGKSGTLLYNIYGSDTYPVNVTKAENLLAARVQDSFWRLNPKANRVSHYAVTAIDRLGNESSALQEELANGAQPRQINVSKLINPPMKSTSKTSKRKKKKRK